MSNKLTIGEILDKKNIKSLDLTRKVNFLGLLREIFFFLQIDCNYNVKIHRKIDSAKC